MSLLFVLACRIRSACSLTCKACFLDTEGVKSTWRPSCLFECMEVSAVLDELRALVDVAEFWKRRLSQTIASSPISTPDTSGSRFWAYISNAVSSGESHPIKCSVGSIVPPASAGSLTDVDSTICLHPLTAKKPFLESNFDFNAKDHFIIL